MVSTSRFHSKYSRAPPRKARSRTLGNRPRDALARPAELLDRTVPASETSSLGSSGSKPGSILLAESGSHTLRYSGIALFAIRTICNALLLLHGSAAVAAPAVRLGGRCGFCCAARRPLRLGGRCAVPAARLEVCRSAAACAHLHQQVVEQRRRHPLRYQ